MIASPILNWLAMAALVVPSPARRITSCLIASKVGFRPLYFPAALALATLPFASPLEQ